jgi:hypothetical protein
VYSIKIEERWINRHKPLYLPVIGLRKESGNVTLVRYLGSFLRSESRKSLFKGMDIFKEFQAQQFLPNIHLT